MSYSLELNHYKKNTNILFTIAIFLMAVLLHQSQVVFGVNISFADLFCIYIFIVLLINNQIKIPITAVSYFLVVSISVLISTVFLVPVKYMFNPEPLSIISEYIKLVALFLYFILGYNLNHNHLMEKIVRWYSAIGVLIGGAGIIFTVFNIRVFSEILFFAGTRFRGFMIDPNYYSILQIAALVYISRINTIKVSYKWLAFFIIFMSVLNSGSKTGIISLLCYLTIRVFEYLLKQNKNAFVVVVQLILLTSIILIVPAILGFLQYLINVLGASIPSFVRIQQLLTDFGGAISENGSGRDVTWRVAFGVIQLSPIIGVGIGTYSTVAFQMFHSDEISHNTFLQLSAEWGIPLAFLLFFYIFFLLGKATTARLPNTIFNHILRDIIIILLLGSIAISLNNARLLWLVLGALVSSLYRDNTQDMKEGKNEKENDQLFEE
ncbi:O-antigen ligase family protein [Neobacillus sp. K501]